MVSALMKSGADPKSVQALARHSSAEMTLGVYAKLGRDDERNALERLASLPGCAPDDEESQRGTGTAGAENSVASSVAFCPASACGQVQSDTPSTPPSGPENAVLGREDGGGNGTRIELFLEGAVSLDRVALERLLAA